MKLKSGIIFQAKKMEKELTVDGCGKIRLTARNGILDVKLLHSTGTIIKSYSIDETRIGEILTRRDESNIDYKIIRSLCENHTRSSSKSLFISGTIVNNFHANKTFPGRKLFIELKTRTPFRNPFCSGDEKEYFLVGEIRDIECSSVCYLGKHDEVDNPININLT